MNESYFVVQNCFHLLKYEVRHQQQIFEDYFSYMPIPKIGLSTANI